PQRPRRGLRCRSKRNSASFGSVSRLRPYSEDGPSRTSESPLSAIQRSLNPGRPLWTSIRTSGSVYGPEVSYTRSGGLPPLCEISRMGTLKFPTWILRELGSGWIAASSTWAVAARNFGLAFMCASLRRDYPHQVVRDCLTRAFSEPAQDP